MSEPRMFACEIFSEVSQNFDTNLVNKGAQVLEDFFLFHISAIPFNEHIKKYYIQH